MTGETICAAIREVVPEELDMPTQEVLRLLDDISPPWLLAFRLADERIHEVPSRRVDKQS